MKYMTNKIKIIIIIIIGAIGLSCWYYYENTLWEKVPNNKYISKIKTDGIRVRVTIPNENSLYEIVDMSFFNGFETGYKFKDAVRVYGHPDNVIESKGEEAFEYWKKNGRVQIHREDIGEDETSWSLRAYPNNIDYRLLLSQEISKRVNPNNEKSIIVIDTDKGDLLMVIVIDGYRVDYLSWSYLRFKTPKP